MRRENNSWVASLVQDIAQEQTQAVRFDYLEGFFVLNFLLLLYDYRIGLEVKFEFVVLSLPYFKEAND